MPYGNYNPTGGSGQVNNPYNSPYGANSPMSSWEDANNYRRYLNPYDFTTGGFDPNNAFGTTYVNPHTGETFAMTPGMEIDQRWNEIEKWDRNLGDHGWVSPGNFSGINIGGQSFVGRGSDGSLDFNFGALSGAFGGGGTGLQTPGGYAPTGFTPTGITAPEGFDVESYQNSMVDVSQIIDAEKRLSDVRREDAWADAAARFGQSGAVASTPYMDKLGQVAADEQAMQDKIFGELKYAAGTDYAHRMQAEQMAKRQLDYDVWAQSGAWDMGAQGMNSDQAFQKWLAENNMGMTDYWNKQNWNLDNAAINQQGNQQLYGIGADMMNSIMSMSGSAGSW